MARKKLTLSIDAELIERMKVQCVMEKRDLSTITEDLYSNYLERFAQFEKLMEKEKKKP
jgi:hypothetical protein